MSPVVWGKPDESGSTTAMGPQSCFPNRPIPAPEETSWPGLLPQAYFPLPCAGEVCKGWSSHQILSDLRNFVPAEGNRIKLDVELLGGSLSAHEIQLSFSWCGSKLSQPVWSLTTTKLWGSQALGWGGTEDSSLQPMATLPCLLS